MRTDLFMAALTAALLAAGAARAVDIDAGRHERQLPTAAELTPQQEMFWKYSARCALRPDQELEAPVGPDGRHPKFKGLLGLAPEWRDGKCDATCQEKVSSCLAALTNQTAKHVQLSLTSEAMSMPEEMRPSPNDMEYPFQEGAFFGNVFEGNAYVCRGRDADKGAQSKRFCALVPGLCTGIAVFHDAGSCEDSCEFACRALPDGSHRCAAVACNDPTGRTWKSPVTVFLHDRIEAGNADTITGAVSRAEALEALQDGGQALYRHVDFGAAGSMHRFVATVTAAKTGGKLEVWLADGTAPIAVLPLSATGGAPRQLSVPLHAPAASGHHDVLLKFRRPAPGVRVADLALR